MSNGKSNNNPPTNPNPTTLIEKLDSIDGFPVEWAGRTAKGDLRLDCNVFEVVDTPPPFFGQNARDFGFHVACDMAGEAEWSEHDFGACYIREKSLRKESDGVWYVDLTVDPHKARHPKVTTMLVNDEGEPILDENGEVQLKTAPRRESWISVRLDQVEPDFEHPLAAEYVQSDRRTKALIAATERSKATKEGRKEGGGGRGKGKRKRLSPSEIAALMK